MSFEASKHLYDFTVEFHDFVRVYAGTTRNLMEASGLDAQLVDLNAFASEYQRSGFTKFMYTLETHVHSRRGLRHHERTD